MTYENKSIDIINNSANRIMTQKNNHLIFTKNGNIYIVLDK